MDNQDTQSAQRSALAPATCSAFRTHDLKTWPVYFDAIWDGLKTFEVRQNDRDYQVGDRLLLRDYDPEEDKYSGDTILAEVTYRMPGGRWGIAGACCVMAIRVIAKTDVTGRDSPNTKDEPHPEKSL